MASPVAAVRQPLAARTINTAFYQSSTSASSTSIPNTIITSSTTSTIQKPLAGTKRLHSQISTTGQENVNFQQQILNTAAATAFKVPFTTTTATTSTSTTSSIS